jgi:hypothetical protein
MVTDPNCHHLQVIWAINVPNISSLSGAASTSAVNALHNATLKMVNTISFQQHTVMVSSTRETTNKAHCSQNITLFHLLMDAQAQLSLISILAVASVKHSWRCVIIRTGRTSWYNHQKVNTLYFWHMLGTKITIPAILNAQYFSSIRLLTDGILYPQRCFRHFNPLIAKPHHRHTC